jgi:hypothetical protein
LAALTPEHTNIIIHALQKEGKLDVESLLSLIAKVTETLNQDPTLIDLRETVDHVTVVGDLHGSLPSLTHLLSLLKMDDRNGVVFDGDFVDRGEQSLEVLCTLMLLKLCYPKNVVLLRGNHEDTMVAGVYGK